ncbi:MAG: tRNA pseudouridine(38-40) synthase TruA [Ruminococcaceae bacterium]|nr:tRNA pseudouridine(38-40) synthase TruA [Oscillospiraceae bacterium]
MRNLLLEISYNGMNYHGWQVQANAVTIQEKLQDAIEVVFGNREDVKGCSRTDSGVHANVFCCNFKTDKNIPAEKVPDALNANLPCDISVKSCKEMPLGFHARYDCKGKEYVYKIWNSSTRNPFLDKLCYFYKYHLDEKLLSEEAKDFIGKHDFSAFCAAGSSVEDKIREIYSFDVRREGDMVLFIVSGNGFLYNMVRIMVGTLLDISSRKIERGSIPEIIQSKNRSEAGFTVISDGLYLNDVYY